MADRKILLVEGKDDENVLKHLCDNRNVGWINEIKPYGGTKELLENFPVRLKASEEGDVIGVIIDADTDLAARWQSLWDRLIGAGYQAMPLS